MLGGIRVRFKWRGAAYVFGLTVFMAAYIVVMLTIAGVIAGLPWPPRWDDYLFGMTIVFALPFVVVGGIFVRDLARAIREALAIRAAPLPRPTAPEIWHHDPQAIAPEGGAGAPAGPARLP